MHKATLGEVGDDDDENVRAAPSNNKKAAVFVIEDVFGG